MYRNPRTAATSRISLNPPPYIDPTKATLAYGRLAIGRLNQELQDTVLLTRQRAVRTLCDYLHDPEHISEAINEDIIPTLKSLLKDPDVPCRAMAAECFVVINGHSIGREAFINSKAYDVMKLLFAAYEPDIVRINAHRSVELLSIHPRYAEKLAKQEVIPLLIACLEREFTEVQIVILDTLIKCLPFDTDAGLDANGICVFNRLLIHHDSAIRHKSAQAILRLVVSNRGKIQAIEKEIVPRLINLLADIDPEVRASAAGALAFICIETKGRYACLDGEAIPNLLRCLINENSRVRVNALKTLTCLAEAPEGRRILTTHLEQIECMLFDGNALVQKHAKIAVDVIKWKPWDLESKCRDVSSGEKLCDCYIK